MEKVNGVRLTSSVGKNLKVAIVSREVARRLLSPARTLQAASMLILQWMMTMHRRAPGILSGSARGISHPTHYHLGELLALVFLDEMSGTADPGVRLAGRPGNSFL